MKILPYEEDVTVYSPTTGTNRTGLNYFANLLHGDGARLPLYTTRELRIYRPGDATNGRFKGKAGFKLKTFGPLNVIAVSSCFMSLGLLVWAVWIGDGVATIGIAVMSLAAPFLCVGTRWSLAPPGWVFHEFSSLEAVFQLKSDFDKFLAISIPEIARTLSISIWIW